MEVRARLTPREGRRFAFTIGLAFLFLGGLLAWRARTILSIIALSLGAACLLAGLVVPGRLSGVYHAWMRLGHEISKLTSPIVMGAVYFLLLSPIGALLRLTGRNPLRSRELEGGFWSAPPPSKPSDLENQF